MRISDTIAHAWGNLWKKKLRTFLTTFGVVIGVGALVCMFAFGQGVQKNITDRFEQLDLFNYINVFAEGASMRGSSFDPDDPDSAARDEFIGRPRAANPQGPKLDDAFLEEVSQMDGVEAVFPEMRFPAELRLGDQEEFTLVQVLSAHVCQSSLVQLRAGSPYTADDANELIVSDMLLRRLGVRKPEEAVGRQVEVRTLTFDFSFKGLMRMALWLGGSGGSRSDDPIAKAGGLDAATRGGSGLPFSSRSYDFTIVGVAERMGFGGPMPIRSDVFLPPQTARRMRKLVLTSVSDLFESAAGGAGYSMITIRVTSPVQVASVKEKLEARGLRTFALMDQLEEMRIGFIIMDVFLLAVGMIGITVASLGIVNTMVMSILERYREIGIMKAVGATDGDVQKIFLVESGVIGFLGGLFGLALGWIVSFVINQVVNGLTARQGVPFIHYFRFPWWLCLGAISFSILISLIAGILPTLRAARIDPVAALRHD
jgi:putative ABC transport system permease protein